ncbi:MAG: ribosome maturation factor RimP [Pseudomonadales bacterium]|nr:ribosome maturation factor RimP [Pseudomonadales bacterium]
MVLTQSTTRVAELIEPAVNALDLELWGIEHLSQGHRSILRIFIESDAGVTIEDCERVSRQVSGILDVEEPIGGAYTLEVSSPGLDRPLFTLAQFSRYTGELINVRLRMPQQGRKKFKGLLEKVDGENICLIVDGEQQVLPFSAIDKASIVF